MARSAERMIKELCDLELTTSTSLKKFAYVSRDLCREISFTLLFQADMLEAGLKTLPIADAKFGALTRYVRAKAVAWCLRAAADAVQHAGRNSVKCWALFIKYYAPEIAAAEAKKKPKFTIDKAA